MQNKIKDCPHILCEYVKVKGIKDEVMMCKKCKLGIRTKGGEMLMTPLSK